MVKEKKRSIRRHHLPNISIEVRPVAWTCTYHLQRLTFRRYLTWMYPLIERRSELCINNKMGKRMQVQPRTDLLHWQRISRKGHGKFSSRWKTTPTCNNSSFYRNTVCSEVLVFMTILETKAHWFSPTRCGLEVERVEKARPETYNDLVNGLDSGYRKNKEINENNESCASNFKFAIALYLSTVYLDYSFFVQSCRLFVY